MNTVRWALALLAVSIVATACGGTDEDAGPGVEPVELVLLTHDSFFVSEGVLAAFTSETGIDVTLLRGGDGGTVVNQAILTKDNPTADLLFGIDNTFLSRALDEELFVPYRSLALSTVDSDLILDDQNRVTPIDFGDVCINYDIAALVAAGTAPPTSLRDLTDPRFASSLVVQDPATSSPGLSFLLATIATFGEDGEYTWRDFWSDLVDNDVLVTSGWEDAYSGSFSGGAGEGDRPIVVSYASSPTAEVFYADPQPDEAPTASMVDGCFRQVEFAAILRGTEHEEEAGQLIDFMLSPPFQEDIPLSMFVFPAVRDTPLPAVFVDHATVAASPAQLDPTTIAANRERWIQEWTDLQR